MKISVISALLATCSAITSYACPEKEMDIDIAELGNMEIHEQLDIQASAEETN